MDQRILDLENGLDPDLLEAYTIIRDLDRTTDYNEVDPQVPVLPWFDTGSLYLDQSLYEISRLLIGPITVLLNYSSMIKIVFYCRLIHLITDLSELNDQTKAIIKQLFTCYYGLYQLNLYYQTFYPDHSLSLISTTALSILYCFIVTKFCSRYRVRKSTHNVAIFAVVVVCPILINECSIYIYSLDYLHSLRAILMVMTMKMTSLCLANDTSDFLTTVAYLAHPASSILGPWHNNQLRSQATDRKEMLKQFVIQLKSVGYSLLKTIIILTISMNIIEIKNLGDLILDNNMAKATSGMYFTAQDFRFNHYFACLFSQTLLLFWDWHDQVHVCDIIKVEWPRSLVEVVVSWNIPMHRWLKQCIFRPLSRSRFNIIFVVMTTYTCSSILHGFKFHIWAVLLSLGIASWVEHRLRGQLAVLLSACVLARPCKLDTRNACFKLHSRTNKNSYVVVAINTVFRILAMLQLAYLGSIFIGNTDQSSHKEALRIWSGYFYFGHLMCITMLSIYMTVAFITRIS